MAVIALLLGISGGYYRAEVWGEGSAWAGHHGALMVGGFLGTLIAVERAVTLPKWALLVPLINGSSLVAWAFHLPDVAYIALLFGGMGLTLLTWWPIRTKLSWHGVLIWLGSAWYTVGVWHFLTQGWYVPVFPWWMAFFLFTIVGERLELSRYLPIQAWAKALLVILLGVFLLGILLPYHTYGRWLMALSLLGSGCWLLRFDMARKAIRKTGVHRFVAGNLLMGYGWLLVTALLLWQDLTGGGYDASLHSFFIGFVLAMVMAHAPIIFPGVFRLVLQPYHPLLWIWTVLLHGSLVIRLLGDYAVIDNGHRWGSAINGIAIVGYLITIALRLLVMYHHKARQ